MNTAELNNLLKDEIAALLKENDNPYLSTFTDLQGKKPYLIMVVGVNGVCKTTTI